MEVEGERKEEDWIVVHLGLETGESMREFCRLESDARHFCVMILVLRNALGMFFGWPGKQFCQSVIW